jgi:hypothetical protein
MSRFPWWFGVVLFPVVPLLSLLSGIGSRTFIAVSTSAGDPNVGVGIDSFLLTVVAFWGGILIALVVLLCLLADIRVLKRDQPWSPHIAWALAGVVHLAGTVFSTLFILSVPALSYYLYRRHERV